MKIALASSHGGHLTEILSLRDAFEGHQLFLVTFQNAPENNISPVYHLKKFHNDLFEAFAVWFRIFRVFRKERPKVVFSTGAEIAIPAFLIGKFFFGCKLAYLECSAQVITPSITGRIVYPFCDLFLVQWEPLLKKYGPKAQYRGGLI